MCTIGSRQTEIEKHLFCVSLIMRQEKKKKSSDCRRDTEGQKIYIKQTNISTNRKQSE